MGWQFAAVWVDDPTGGWNWTWRRLADDSGAVIAHSAQFAHLEECVADARRNGFEESGCDPTE